MEEIKRILILRITKQLEAIGAQYYIAVGNEAFGALPEPKKAKETRKRNGISAYVSEFIRGMNPGDVVVVPNGSFQPPQLQSAIASVMLALYGPGQMTHRVEGGIEVMRT